MKNILVPTDFSDAANNAVEYAIQLASSSGAAIVLLNVYHLPLPAGEMPLMLVAPHDIIWHSNKRLHELEQSISISTEGRIAVSSTVREGMAADEIVTVAKERACDLIVMGNVGSTSALTVLMGSVTTAVAKKSTVPVLSVPLGAHYRAVQSIVFAYDCQKEPQDSTVGYLKSLSQTFHAELKVVNVVKPQSEPEVACVGVDVMDAAQGVSFSVSDDVAGELDRLAKTHKADWLVLAKHDYNFPENLFHRSITKQVVFHSEIPILIIHD